MNSKVIMSISLLIFIIILYFIYIKYRNSYFSNLLGNISDAKQTYKIENLKFQKKKNWIRSDT